MDPVDFAALDRLRKYLATIRKGHRPALDHYISKDKLGFFHQPSARDRASCASTATCVSSLVGAGLWNADHPLWERTELVARRLLKKPRKSAGLDPDNPFSLAFISEAVLDLQLACPEYSRAEEHLKTIRNDIAPLLVESVNATGAVKIEYYPESAYLTQLVTRVLLRVGELDSQLRTKYLTDDVREGVQRWTRSEVDRQIALISAKSKSADPLSLAYAIALSNEVSTDEQNSPESKQIFSHALALFFESQNEDGSWPTSRPLFHYPKVGNAYCYEYEVLTQLLSSQLLRLELLPYLAHLEKAAYLLQKTAYDLQPEQPGVRLAWASGHHPQIAGPESWSTASVYHFVHALDRLAAEGIRRALFSELGSIYSTPVRSKNPDTEAKSFAPDFLDADLMLNNRRHSLRNTIAQAFVFKIARDSHRVAKGQSLPNKTPMSAILFGPPGTSKTQLAKMISVFLGWPLLSVDPSYLVSEGLDRIQALANRLFSMLTASEQIVVLLDEFDEMGRDRARSHELLSRFITTAMLPKLAQINQERKIVFLLATNYVSGFDAAFSRGGRFDMLIQIMPPNRKAKYKRWPELKKKVQTVRAAKKKKDIEDWIDELTYLECDSLVSKLAEVTTQTAIYNEIDVAHKACTLLKLNDIGSGGAEGNDAMQPITWKDTSKQEREQMRVSL